MDTKARIATGATVLGLAGLGGVALSASHQQAADVGATKPLVRTKVIHRTIHVTKHAKPKHPSGAGPQPGAPAGYSGAAAASGGAVTTSSSGAAAAPVESGGESAPVTTSTSGSAAAPASEGGTPVTTATSGGGSAGGGGEGGDGGEHGD